jgi:hypothetical protein
MDDVRGPGGLADIELVPRPVLHGTQGVSPEQGVLYLGRPYTVPLGLQALPEQLQARAAEWPGMVFRQLVMNVNLCPKPGQPIRHVTVSALAEVPAGGERPVFRQVLPSRLARTVTRSSKVSVTAAIGTVQPGAESNCQYDEEEAFLVARGAGTGTAQWEFREVAGVPLDGSYELLATLELPPVSAGNILVSAAASIRKKRLGVIGYQARLPEDLAAVPFR